MDYYDSTEQIMYADVPAQHVPTLYVVAGDLLAWLCLAGMVSVIVSVILPKRLRPGSSRDPVTQYEQAT